MATKVLVLGASGAIAQHVIEALKDDENIVLTLFARNIKGLQEQGPNAAIIKGDVLNKEDLQEAIKGQDIVYANLIGQIDKMAGEIVKAMEAEKIQRLIFITSLGIYHEIPGKFGKWNDRMIGSDLMRYRYAADIIEWSALNYTVILPSWLTDKNETDFETTQKGEPFTGTEVSRKAVATYIVSLLKNPGEDNYASVGIQKPGSQGDKPSFY